MNALVFPSLNDLRLALAGGILPASLVRESVLAHRTPDGRIWTREPGLSREVLAALARIGVRPHCIEIDSEFRLFPCWTALLPLTRRPDVADPVGSVLVRRPVAQVVPMLAAVPRGSAGFRFRIVQESALIEIVRPPLHFLLKLLDDPQTKAFTSAGQNTWVEWGWQTPLDPLPIPKTPGVWLLHGSGEWQHAEPDPWHEIVDRFPLSGSTLRGSTRTDPSLKLSVRIKLKRTPLPVAEPRFWLYRGSRTDFIQWLSDADQRLLRRLEFAQVESSQGYRAVFRRGDKARSPAMPAPLIGLHSHAGLSQLFLPEGWSIHPILKTEALVQAFNLLPKSIAWIEPRTETDWTTVQVAESAFQPFSQVARPVVPRARVLPPVELINAALEFLPFSLHTDRKKGPASGELGAPARPFIATHQPPRTGRGETGSWFSRLARRFLRKDDEAVNGAGVANPKLQRRPPEPDSNSHPSPRRSTTRDVRIAELQQKLLEPSPRWPSESVAATWQELAQLQAEKGHPADAALSLCLAAWWTPQLTGFASNFDNWIEIQRAASGWDESPVRVESVLARSEKPQAAALAALLVIRSAFHPRFGVEADPHFEPLVRVAFRGADQLPIQLLWLLHRAVAERSQGDPLGLARGRDRILQRLTDEGLTLDRDAPAFLRFHGGVTQDRFQATQDWLIHIQGPMQKWLEKQSSTGRLAWAGLDADLHATAAYADFILAWGLSKLGLRQRAEAWAASADATLRKVHGTGVDERVHRELARRFHLALRQAADGRAEDAVEPAQDIGPEPFSELSRYALDKLTARLGVFAKQGGRIDPYQARQFSWLVGADSLGVRLQTWLAANAPPPQSQTQSLLEEVAADPTARVLPRVVISLLSRPQVLDPDAARLTLTLATSAIELLPEALRQLTPTPLGKESVAPLQRLTLLALEGAQRLALLHGFGEAYATAMDALSRSDSGSSFWALLPRFGPGMARAFRKLGQTELAEPIIRRIGQRFPGEDQLSIAGLWLAIGEEARAIRELDLARERLFIQPFPDDRTRGEFALRYIAALEFAPPRLALGRLEELFLRLESVDLAGATARYYALKPLEIVDATVAAVVNDDFNMGPRVRGWLDDHEFQIRKRIARDVENALAYPPEAGASSFSAFGTTR